MENKNGCWDCPHIDKVANHYYNGLRPQGFENIERYCTKHKVYILDRLKCIREGKHFNTEVQCDELEAVRIENRSW